MPEIIMHFPEKQEDIYILQKKVAQVHAEAVVSHLEKLPFPKEQKLALLASLKTVENQRATMEFPR
jgi:hypothetical protein